MAVATLLPPPAPPYVLDTPAFQFRALASLAGRAPLGGEREVVLACFVAARLVVGAAGAVGAQPLPPACRTDRAASARAWLASLALPLPIRAPLGRLADATAFDDRDEIRDALAGVIAVTAQFLDATALSEVERLLDSLDV